jgi:NAD(P)-dependent dehydrogenase (short-subunit alcohol dehydrogenase family)
VVRADVRDGAAVAAMVANVATQLDGAIDLLVNNPGTTTYAAPSDLEALGVRVGRSLGHMSNHALRDRFVHGHPRSRGQISLAAAAVRW